MATSPDTPVMSPPMEPNIGMRTRGGVVQKAGWDKTRWEEIHEEIRQKYNNSPWGIWQTQRDWEDADWIVKSKASQTEIKALLKTQRYKQDPPWFKTVRNLFKIIDSDLEGFGRTDWQVLSVTLPEAPDDQHVFVFRDVEKVGDDLISTPRFAGQVGFQPVAKFGKDGVREYDEVYTGDDFHTRQRDLQPGVTLGAGIMMSDETHLNTHSGDASAHAVYYSLGNINKAVREDISQGAWALVGIIPKSKWENTFAKMGEMSNERKATLTNMFNRRLFHYCMEILVCPFRRTQPHEVLDPEGKTRLVQYVLMIYGADLEEQCHAAGISSNCCPHCHAKAHQLGDPGCKSARTSADILERIRLTKHIFQLAHNGRDPTPEEFLKEGKNQDLNGVEHPFWRNLPNFDICNVLSPDMLHGVHKMFYDHVQKWNSNGLGSEEYDARLKSQIPITGERMFPNGVTRLKQLAGKEHRALERVHLGVVANAPGQAHGGQNLKVKKLTKATRAIMDSIFLAQYEMHREDTLQALDESYQDFHANKQVWIENKTKYNKKKKNKGKNGKGGGKGANDNDGVIKNWAIPKIHIVRHIVEHVRRKGTMDNYNTETMEHLHRPCIKDPYNGSNRKAWIAQLIRWLKRHERMRDCREFLHWHQGELAKEAAHLHLETLVSAAGDEDEDVDTDYEYESELDIEWDDSSSEGSMETDFDFEEEVEEEVEKEVEEAEWHNGLGRAHGSAPDLGASTHGILCDNSRHEERRKEQEAQERREPRLLLNQPEQPERAFAPQFQSHHHAGGSSNTRQVNHTYGMEPQLGNVGDSAGHIFPTTIAPLYTVSQRAEWRGVVLNAVIHTLGFPKLVQHIAGHPYFASLPITIDETSSINIWPHMRLTIPRHCTSLRK
ncbi:hypothetical protein FRC11_009177 [Ceratobasidium sp. 423]|nr:hypothetical protein FRC11_009177 [Ceratobasidium sp. 423]